MNKKTIIVIWFVLILITGFGNNIYAANCGDTDYNGTTDTPCACGDTIVGAEDYVYKLTEDLTCTGHGLYVGANNITIDGNIHTITGDGESVDNGINNSGGWDNITVQNFSNISSFGKGIYFENSSNSTIQNNTATLNTNGIYFYNSSGNHLNGNTSNQNTNAGFYIAVSNSNDIDGNITNQNGGYGIYLSSSSLNNMQSNVMSFNNKGIVFSASSTNNFFNNSITSNIYGVNFSSCSGNVFTENSIADNKNDFFGTIGSNTLSFNRFRHNIANRAISFVEVERIKDVADTINFDVSTFNLNGTDCDGCGVITTSPFETITIDTESGNDITGHFVVNKSGTYSLIFTVTDSKSNITERIMRFFVGDTDYQTTKYYFRAISPIHGQPFGNGRDSKSLLLTIPTSSQYWYCTVWIQTSPDDIPDYPLASLSDVNSNSWYKSGAGYIGIKRYTDWDEIVDFSDSVFAQGSYAWVTNNFSDLNWGMDYFHSWYWVALKLFGSNPFWITFPSEEYSDQPSYADFTYEYTTTPAIKSISDEDIMVLSATADASDTGIISIVLEDTLTSDTSTMDIVLSSPVRLDISIDAWNTSDPYYKQWVEEASEEGITAMHMINGFAPNTYYMVNKDGVLVGLYLSDGSGQITFTAFAGSVFSVVGLDTIFQTYDGEGGDGSHCFIATVAYGTPVSDEVKVLRRFRNEYLLTNPIGESFVDGYYRISPRIADFIREHPILKSIVRNALNPLVWISAKIIELKLLN